MSVYSSSGEQLSALYDRNGNLLTSAYSKSGEEVFQSGDASQLTIMSFNVGSFYSTYVPAPSSTGTVFFDRNKNIFDNYTQIDFAGFPEWYNQIGTVSASQLMNLFFSSYYPNYTPYASANHALTSAFSGTPTSVTLHTFSNQSGETRYYQKSYIEFNGTEVCCILTHLHNSDASVRAAQFLELMDVVENEDYFILLGDFNFHITQVGDNEYNNSVAVALANGYNSAQNANNLLMTWYSGETVADSSEQYALDNIITSANIDIVDVSVDTTKLTDGLCETYGIIIDHLPLVARVEIS